MLWQEGIQPRWCIVAVQRGRNGALAMLLLPLLCLLGSVPTEKKTERDREKR
jgi:hypothetical protein